MRAPEFWAGHDRMAQLAIAALRPIGWAYGASVAFKAASASPYRSKANVICVGNLTAGGTGKTPIAIAVARALIARGCKAFLLTRGYGGRQHGPALVNPAKHLATDVGDEALLLAAAAPTIVSRDRAAGARLAELQGADTIVMDDGHQNFTLQKDLSLIVIDSEEGFGNGHILPAGPLREPVPQGLDRADAVVLLGEGDFDLPVGKPLLHASVAPVRTDDFAGNRVVAFAGIGRPEKFFRTLKANGAEIAATFSFTDHHAYSETELIRLRTVAAASGAPLVTTEKDYVRLSPAERGDVHILRVRATFRDPDELNKFLDLIALRHEERVPA